MTEQLELFKDRAAAKLEKPVEKRTSGLHMEAALYDKAAKLGEEAGLSTNAVLVQLIKIGFSVVEENE